MQDVFHRIHLVIVNKPRPLGQANGFLLDFASISFFSEYQGIPDVNDVNARMRACLPIVHGAAARAALIFPLRFSLRERSAAGT